MSGTGRILLPAATRCALRRVTLIQPHPTSWRLNHVRPLAVSSLMQTPSNDEEPIKFSTSKGSHRTWRVDRSLGSNFQRPWWKVVPISLFCSGFLLWCMLRKETGLDKQMVKPLYEHMPGLLSDDKDVENKSS